MAFDSTVVRVPLECFWWARCCCVSGGLQTQYEALGLTGIVLGVLCIVTAHGLNMRFARRHQARPQSLWGSMQSSTCRAALGFAQVESVAYVRTRHMRAQHFGLFQKSAVVLLSCGFQRT